VLRTWGRPYHTDGWDGLDGQNHAGETVSDSNVARMELAEDSPNTTLVPGHLAEASS
jgi:hypothetical protein